MADKGKVLKGLECCADRTARKCLECPYDFVNNDYCMGDMARDALELLREQPEQKHGHWISTIKGEAHYTCSCCGTGRYMNFIPDYCSSCGARMDEEVKKDD